MNDFIFEEIETLSGENVIKRTDANGIQSWIPVDPCNSDYAAYLKSVNDNSSEA